jgi:hypothetical protein
MESSECFKPGDIVLRAEDYFDVPAGALYVVDNIELMGDWQDVAAHPLLVPSRYACLYMPHWTVKLFWRPGAEPTV